MLRKIQVGRGALMRVRKSPKKSRWEVEDGGSSLLSRDVHAIQFGWALKKKVPQMGSTKPLGGGEVLVGKLGFSGSLSQRTDSFEKAPVKHASTEKDKPLLPIARGTYYLV